MLFWAIAAVLAAVAAFGLARPLWRAAGGGGAARPEMAIYRNQLAEVERDLARGVLDPDEAARTRTEIARRLLAADRTATPDTATATAAGPQRGLALGLALAVGAAALGLYAYLGAPGTADQPRALRLAAAAEALAQRPSQEQAVAAASTIPRPPAEVPEDYLNLVQQLRDAVATRPDDPQGLTLLARHEAALGNYAAALAAQQQLVALRGATVSTDELAMQADLMVAAAEGFVSPETEALLRDILERDEQNIPARYYLGLMYAQNDRPDLAFRFWRDLVASGQDDLPHVQFARGQIEDVAFLAGVEYTLPPESGASAADVAAAADMSPEDRAAMVQGMVAQLADRLATEGGPAADWAQLIRALGVLGETDRAQAIWTEAQAVFASDASGLAAVKAAADAAGLGQ